MKIFANRWMKVLCAALLALLLAWLPSQFLQANPATRLGAEPNSWRAIAAGGEHTCAITHLGVLKCWGIAARGFLGEPADRSLYPPSSVPVTVPGLAEEPSTFVAIDEDHTCTVSQSGKAKCWGINTWGQLGNGTFNNAVLPVPVIGLGSDAGSGATSIGVGHIP